VQKQQSAIGISIALFVLFSVGILAFSSCTSFHPYRTASPGTAMPCRSDLKGRVDRGACSSAAWEIDPDYDLFFAEFDDQGLAHPADESSVGFAFQQIAGIDDALRSRFKVGDINLIVYVHGWKHDARSEDSDVEKFRQLLHSVKVLEDAKHPKSDGDEYLAIPHRRVVGIFVGWRGLSTTVEPFKELSFWGRKETSSRVAVGSARELFSRLRAYQQMRNANWDKQWTQTPGKIDKIDPSKKGYGRPPVQMLILGHSFGAQLVFSAIAENLIETLSSNLSDPGARIQRYGDMIILINPAFEATRYMPLIRVANNRKYDHYLAPLLVTITTTSDEATKLAFPFGRWFDSLLEHYSSSEEHTAALHTIGHLPGYITHILELSSAAEANAVCASWREPGTGTDAADILAKDVKLEQQATDIFFNQYRQLVGGTLKAVLPQAWTRTFCGGTRLKFVGAQNPQPSDGNMPIWNVQTQSPIIVGHNNFETEYLTTFIRQLRSDSDTFYALTDQLQDVTAQTASRSQSSSFPGSH
jgi:hypothetical protein